jgi:hypothetical protein
MAARCGWLFEYLPSISPGDATLHLPINEGPDFSRPLCLQHNALSFAAPPGDAMRMVCCCIKAGDIQ